MTTLRLSKSKIGTFTLCPQKYQYTYVDKIIPEKTPKAMLEGSALHHVIENTIVYGDKIAEISRVASDEFWKDIELTGTEYESPEAMKKAQDSVLKEAETFLSQIDPLNPVDMETYFEYPLFNPETGEVHENILLRGYMDLIDCTDDGIYRVIDIKIRHELRLTGRQIVLWNSVPMRTFWPAGSDGTAVFRFLICTLSELRIPKSYGSTLHGAERISSRHTPCCCPYPRLSCRVIFKKYRNALLLVSASGHMLPFKSII